MSAAKGAYGIPRARHSHDTLTCMACYRAWRDDITPSGRCPWEHLHDTDTVGDIGIRYLQYLKATGQR